ncbi:inosine monophosphate dehydrogenase [Exidia glandulosa HHB12029]|uniref:Inosine monophosphate dehydrogenase n=1 Tax=Exidia glandulosa HHB12029 TaxID=1314781 RepID=A0A166BM90_EXIGL|nr:inosine monophosphate dehydrogenase [Exidia glandulosa HHB12029]
MRTPLTNLLKCRIPLFGASMAGCAGGALAAAVSKAGGFGFIGIAMPSNEYIDAQLDIARKALGVESGRLPIGMGFLGWWLESVADGETYIQRAAPQVQVVWLSFGRDLRKWYDVARAADASVKIAVVVNTAAEALTAASWGADILIAQGVEAGGHGAAKGVPTISLLPVVFAALQAKYATSRPVLLAAGGISTGAQAAAALALGADGAVIGTRLLATPECIGYSDAQKNAIVAADESSTARTMVFDEVRGTTGWPEGIDGRGLCNKTYYDDVAGRPFAEIKADFDVALKNGDVSRMVTWSGTSVGSVSSVKPAEVVIRELEDEMISSIRRIHDLI